MEKLLTSPRIYKRNSFLKIEFQSLFFNFISFENLKKNASTLKKSFSAKKDLGESF